MEGIQIENITGLRVIIPELLFQFQPHTPDQLLFLLVKPYPHILVYLFTEQLSAA